MTNLEKIYPELSSGLKVYTEVETILLSEDQLLISKNMRPNPAPQEFKTPALTPAPDGYAIYIHSPLPASRKGHPEQRVSLPSLPIRWNSSTMKLRLNTNTLDQTWQLLNQADEFISITVHCGSKLVFAEVDAILAIIERLLLR